MAPEAGVQIPAPTLPVIPMGRPLIKKNARNITIVAGPLVIKFSRDGNIFRIFKEFYLTWKAFLNGLSVPVLLLGPFLIRPRVLLLKEAGLRDREDEIIRAIKKLSSARVEHRELRHPERHIGFWLGKVVFIDFDRGRLSTKSRDLNKFMAWLRSLKGKA